KNFSSPDTSRPRSTSFTSEVVSWQQATVSSVELPSSAWAPVAIRPRTARPRPTRRRRGVQECIGGFSVGLQILEVDSDHEFDLALGGAGDFGIAADRGDDVEAGALAGLTHARVVVLAMKGIRQGVGPPAGHGGRLSQVPGP